ncbi:MAG: hypothetical protein IT353_11205 [Gemmatimonadaceae bacterium]|jgi:hypothetical protein|nr:hypothetical protein [Gemmatimonadaceae bacterium]
MRQIRLHSNTARRFTRLTRAGKQFARLLPAALCAGEINWPQNASRPTIASSAAALQQSPANARDSAGIRVVEYQTSQAYARTLRIDEKPFFSLGGLRDNDSEELDDGHSLLSLVTLTNGSIVVNEPAQLKFFSRTGAFVRAVGRSGAGPGEFQQTRELCRLRGDSLLVIDQNGRRSIWTSAGAHVQTFPRIGLIPINTCRSDGTVVVVGSEFRDRQSPQRGPTVNYELRRYDGTLVRSLGRLPGHEYLGPLDHEPVVMPIDGALVVSDGMRFEWSVLTSDGRTQTIVRVHGAERPLSDAEWRRLVEWRIPFGGNSGAIRNKSIARMMSMKRPAYFPAIGRVRVDQSSNIWIGDYGDPRRWTVFRKNGELVGRVVLPWAGAEARSELVEIGADYVAVKHFDSDGAVHLTYHRMSRISS